MPDRHGLLDVRKRGAVPSIISFIGGSGGNLIYECLTCMLGSRIRTEGGHPERIPAYSFFELKYVSLASLSGSCSAMTLLAHEIPDNRGPSSPCFDDERLPAAFRFFSQQRKI